MKKPEKNEPVLYVYSDRSLLIDEDGNETKYEEGKPSDTAKERLKYIKEQLDNGFLEKIIEECQNPEVNIEDISEEQVETIKSLVDSVTSEVGRAIVGLTILQLTVKSIIPEQSIRLHKSSFGAQFSWKEGVPMRVLDKNYITPVLRKYNLLKLNADGFMMTRSLAENYPYSKLYKAAIRGAKSEWMEITDSVEAGKLNSINALKQLIVFLHNNSEAFKALSEEAKASLQKFIDKKPDFNSCYLVVKTFIEHSTYSARIFEVSLHSLFQVFEDAKCLQGFVKPLSQMRSANKKHGNVGDIELTLSKNYKDIIEAWDAKYGKTYLRDELEELNDKLTSHPHIKLAGFVTDQKPNLKAEIEERIKELEILHETAITVVEFEEWVSTQIEKYGLDPNEIGVMWLVAILESICQLRRDRAPIDEPTKDWVKSFIDAVK